MGTKRKKRKRQTFGTSRRTACARKAHTRSNRYQKGDHKLGRSRVGKRREREKENEAHKGKTIRRITRSEGRTNWTTPGMVGGGKLVPPPLFACNGEERGGGTALVEEKGLQKGAS